MTIVVILVLAGLWAAVLVPPLLRARHEHRGNGSIGSFNRNLGVLGRTNGSDPRSGGLQPRPSRPLPAGSSLQPPAPRRGAMSPVQRRRRDVLFGLAGAVGLLFVVAVVVGGPAWLLWLASVGLLGAYVVMLLRIKQAAAERRSKVRYLPRGQPATTRSEATTRSRSERPGLVLRRTASSS